MKDRSCENRSNETYFCIRPEQSRSYFNVKRTDSQCAFVIRYGYILMETDRNMHAVASRCIIYNSGLGNSLD